MHAGRLESLWYWDCISESKCCGEGQWTLELAKFFFREKRGQFIAHLETIGGHHFPGTQNGSWKHGGYLGLEGSPKLVLEKAGGRRTINCRKSKIWSIRHQTKNFKEMKAMFFLPQGQRCPEPGGGNPEILSWRSHMVLSTILMRTDVGFGCISVPPQDHSGLDSVQRELKT